MPGYQPKPGGSLPPRTVRLGGSIATPPKAKSKYIAVSDGMIFRKDRIISIILNFITRDIRASARRHGYQLEFSIEESVGKTRGYTSTQYFLEEDEAKTAGEKKFNEIMEELSK